MEKASSAPALKTFLKDMAMIGACILLLEVMLRIFLPQPLQKMLRYVYEPANNSHNYQFKPNVSVVCNNGFGDHVFSINSWRCRDREYGLKQPGEWRILVAGDSFSENQALPAESIYPNSMEENLKKAYPDRQFSVVNAGMAGWRLWSFYDYLSQWLPVINPDVVIIAVSTSSDVVFTASPPAKRPMKIMAGLPVQAKATIADRIAWAAWFLNQQLECYSHAFIAFRRSTMFLFEWLRVGKIPGLSPLVKGTTKPEWAFEPTRMVIGKIKSLCDSRHIPLVIMHVPAWYECMPGEQWFKIQLERPDVKQIDFKRPSRLMQQIADTLNTPFFDPSERLSQGTQPAYFPGFWHWNETGNQIVADGLQRFLEAHNLLGPRT